MSNPCSISPSDCKLDSAGTDGTSSVTWSPNANYLVSSNWDGGIRCWEVQEQNGVVRSIPKAMTNHENQSPALCTAFSSDGRVVFSGGADKAVRMWNLAEQPQPVAQKLGVHDAAVKGVAFLPSTNVVVSGSFDRTLKFWDVRQPNPIAKIDLPERVYDLDVRDKTMVVATASRHVLIYDVSQAPREHSREQSCLAYQSRCISAFPDQTGFAIGSIEGKAGIRYLQKRPGKDSFAFLCHREAKTSEAFSVNAIAFQNQSGSFATAGSDGVVSFWNKDSKCQLKKFPAIQQSITCCNFNATGNLFAYASSYDWSKGCEYYHPGMPNDIYVHFTPEGEINPKRQKIPMVVA